MTADEETLVRFIRCLHQLRALVGEVVEKGYLRRSGAGKLSFVQLNLLKFLDSATPRSVGDVMRFMGTSFAAASKAMSRLKEKGLVRAAPNPADLRAQYVAMTAAGRTVVRRYEKVKRSKMRQLLEGSDPQLWCSTLEGIIRKLLRDQELPLDLCLQCGAYYSDECLVADRRCRVRSRRP
jgi:DNA-binding MarR family transcriptional regulator